MSAEDTAQNLDGIGAALGGIELSADRVSSALTRAFASAIISGRSFEQMLEQLALKLSSLALNAALKPLGDGLVSLVGGALGGLGGGSVTAFAEGGVVAGPTFFGSGGSVGLMGERGAEAILPLSRAPDGQLGVAVNGAASRPVAVTVNIATQDAESFRRAEADLSATLARAVLRGQRGL